MQKTSSTEMIKLTIYQFVLQMNQSKKYPTYPEIRQQMNEVIDTAPYLFGDSQSSSTKGTMRSMLSELVNKKNNPRITNVFFQEVNGIQKFFVDPSLIVQKQIENDSKDIIESPNNTNHSDSQYMICDIFTKIGFDIFVPKGDRNQKNSFGKTIEESFSNNIVEVEDERGKFIDVIVMKNNKPVILFEVEESTNVRNGLTRMLTFKDTGIKVKTFIVSSKDSYKKKFDKETKWDTFKDLKSKFLSFSDLKEIFENKKREEIISEVFGI